MAQLVTRLDDELLGEVDVLIADGSRPTGQRRFGSLCISSSTVTHAARSARIADGYRRRPQTGAELAGFDAATRALVAEEPW